MIKKNLLLPLCLTILFIALLSRCTKDVGKPSKAATVNNDTITYVNHIEGIMTTSCVSCHGSTPSGGAPISLDTYEAVKISADNGTLKKTTIDDATMPFGGPPLSKHEQGLINGWVSSSERKSITYENTIKPIMDQYCVSCHGSPLSGGAPVALDSYATVKASADNGTLKQTTIVDETMPYGGPPLTQANKDLITFWLNNGMPEK